MVEWEADVSDAEEGRRFSDTMLYEMREKLDLHMQKNEAEHSVLHQELAELKFKIAPIKKVYDRISVPAQIIGWVIITGATGLVLFIGSKIGEYMARHWRP